jgi:hypothetical protein
MRNKSNLVRQPVVHVKSSSAGAKLKEAQSLALAIFSIRVAPCRGQKFEQGFLSNVRAGAFPAPHSRRSADRNAMCR